MQYETQVGQQVEDFGRENRPLESVGVGDNWSSRKLTFYRYFLSMDRNLRRDRRRRRRFWFCFGSDASGARTNWMKSSIGDAEKSSKIQFALKPGLIKKLNWTLI